MNELKPCPFCGGQDLDYSEKRVQRDHGTQVQYQATIYCKRCHTYGPRILSRRVIWHNYVAVNASLIGLRELAEEAWNRRAISFPHYLQHPVTDEQRDAYLHGLWGEKVEHRAQE